MAQFSGAATGGLTAAQDAKLTAIPTTPMRGTDSAALAAVLGALADGAGTGAITADRTAMTYIKQLVTAIQLIPTTPMRGTDSAALASVLGALNAAAASGAVGDTTVAMGYLKQAITLLLAIPTTAMRGTDNAATAAVVGALADAAAAGAVTDTDTAMAYIKQLVTAIQLIPTTAMRGTDGAALASVVGALDTAAATGVVTGTDLMMAYIKQLVTEGIARDVIIADVLEEIETVEKHLHPDLSVTTPNGRLRVGAMTFVDVAANTETVTLGKAGGASRIYTFKTAVDTPAAGNVTIKVQATQALSAQKFANAVNGVVDAVNIGYGDAPTAHPDFACSYTGQRVSIGSVVHTGATVVVVAKIGDSAAVCTFTNTLTSEVLTAITRIYNQRYVLTGNAAALIDRIAGAYQCVCPMNSVIHPTGLVPVKYDIGKMVVEANADDAIIVECDGYYSTDEVTFVPLWYGLEMSRTPVAKGCQTYLVNSHQIPAGAGFYVKMRSDGTTNTDWIDFKAQYHLYPVGM